MTRKHLGAARLARNDEFYTQYVDIEKEMNAYLEFDRPTSAHGPTILSRRLRSPCQLFATLMVIWFDLQCCVGDAISLGK
jgi:hypothetical protein